MSQKEPVRRYSQAFKLQVVREYEAGSSIYQLLEKYGIGAHKTVERWVKQFGRSGYRSEKIVIQSPEDQVEFKAMKNRIEELEKALASAVLDNRMLKATIEVAEETFDIDLKKLSAKK